MNMNTKPLFLITATFFIALSTLVHAQTPVIRVDFDTNAFVDTIGARTITTSGFTYFPSPFNGGKKAMKAGSVNSLATISPSYTLPTSWTIMTWFKAPFNVGQVHQTLTRGSSLDHHVLLQNGILGSYSNSGGGFSASNYDMYANFNSRTDWSHFAAVGTTNGTLFYINGTYIAQSSFRGGDNIYAIYCYQGGGQVWNTQGNYDFRVYDSALTSAQITAAMNEVINTDTTPPAVSFCPASFSVAGNRAVSWTTPTASDNSGGAVTSTVTSSPVSGLTTSGNVFPVGNHTLTYVFSDPSNNKANCTFTINALDCRANVATPSLRAATSGVIGDNLKLDILSSYGYNTTTIVFSGASNTSCGNAAGVYWNASSGVGECGSLWTGVMPLNYALAQCAFSRDELQTTSTVYGATLKITTTMLVGSFRGIPNLMRTIDTYVNIKLAFDTAINVTSTSLNVYGPALTFGRITSQTFNPSTYTATLILFTSSQFPYQLDSASLVNVGGFVTSIVPRVVDPSRASAANCSTNSNCDQYWTITIQVSNACNPGPSTLANSGWLVNFGVLCRTTFTGSCATPAPNTASLNFDTSSGNFCPTLISTQSSTATLTAYDDTTYAPADIISEYVFGSRVYYQAVVTSFISIEHLRIERVTIVSGAATANQVVYQNPFTTAAAYFGASGTVGTYLNQPAPFAANTFAQSPSLMTIAENVTASGALTRSVRFSWIWSGATSSAATDASVSTTVKVDLRIRYRNQSTVSLVPTPHHQLLSVYLSAPSSSSLSADDTKRNTRVRLQEDVDNGNSLNAVSTVSVTGASTGSDSNNPIVANDGTSSSNNSEVPASMVVAGIAGVVIAAIAVIAIIAVVMKERNSKMATATSDK